MKTVYLLPGTMCTNLLWQELLPLLSPGISWQSIPLPGGNSFDEMADELLTILSKK